MVCRGPNYIEVDVDVGSSRSAASVVSLVQGALSSLVVDLAVLLEGRTIVRASPPTSFHPVPKPWVMFLVPGIGVDFV